MGVDGRVHAMKDKKLITKGGTTWWYGIAPYVAKQMKEARGYHPRIVKIVKDNFKDEFGDTSGSGINGDVLHMEVPFTDILEALNTIILNQRELIDFLRQYTSYPISVKYQKYSGPGPY